MNFLITKSPLLITGDTPMFLSETNFVVKIKSLFNLSLSKGMNNPFKKMYKKSFIHHFLKVLIAPVE